MKVLLYKEIVLETNSSDLSYILINKKTFYKYKRFLEENKKNYITLYIKIYETRQDKETDNVQEIRKVKIRDLELCSVKSYFRTFQGERDDDYNIYRVKYYSKKTKTLYNKNNIVNNVDYENEEVKKLCV